MSNGQSNQDTDGREVQPVSTGHHHHHSHHSRHSHHSSHSHRSHRRKPFRHLRHWFRKHRNTVAIAIACTMVAVIFCGYFLWKQSRAQKSLHVSSTASYDMGSGYRNIEYNGVKYKYNSLITTVLYAGVDSEGEMRSYVQAGQAPRADSINLIVLDKKHNKMSIIALNRDTITRIRRYTVLGDDYDYYDSALTYTYAYGNGADTSCENLTEAVSFLLGIPVNDYLVTNRDSMQYFNDLVGGVTVTVPNNDLADEYPSVRKGRKIEITSDFVSTYLRSRDTEKDFSNAGRIERQRSYINAYVDKIKEMLPDRRNEIWEKLVDMDHYLQTSVTRNKYLQYAKLLSNLDYTDADFYEPAGEYTLDPMYHYFDDFYVDEAALKELVLDLFYEPE